MLSVAWWCESAVEAVIVLVGGVVAGIRLSEIVESGS